MNGDRVARILGEEAGSNDLALELFHRVNRIIPADQSLMTIPPETSCSDALSRMRAVGYSQVPVVAKGRVLGVFSATSFARAAANGSLRKWNTDGVAPGELPVDECLDGARFVRVEDEMNAVIEYLDRDGVVLVGAPDNLLGLLTPIDLVRYLNWVASPFVMLSEIELAVRELIRSAMSIEEIEAAAVRCLGGAYATDAIPRRLEDMTFDNYCTLVSYADNWARIEYVIGGSRKRASAKLKEVRDIRNAVFHFKREITMEDHETLAAYRDWLLSKVQQLDLRRPGETDGGRP